METQNTVFISYRRANLPLAKEVRSHLLSKGYDVFLDVESIDSGSWRRILLGQIAARAHFILILTPFALERCQYDTDILRLEIETAIDLRRNIVPLCFDGFTFDSIAKQHVAENEMLKHLPEYNGIVVPPDYTEEALNRLVSRFLARPIDVLLHPTPPDEQEALSDLLQRIESLLEIKSEGYVVELFWEAAIRKQQGGDFQGAISDYTNALQLEPNKWQLLCNRGWLRSLVGEVNSGKADLFAALDQCPDEPFINNNLGIAHFAAGEYVEAIHFYSRALEAKPNWDNALINRSLAYSYVGKYENAIEDLKKALDTSARLHEIYTNLGLAHYQAGQISEAVAAYEASIKLTGAHAISYVGLASCYNTLKQPDEALDALRFALKLDPRRQEIYLNLGHANRLRGQNRESIIFFNIAIAMNGRFAEAYMGRGLSYLSEGDYEQAILDCSTAVEFGHASRAVVHGALVNRALCHLAKRDFEAAAEDFERALSLNPEDISVRELQNRLLNLLNGTPVQLPLF